MNIRGPISPILTDVDDLTRDIILYDPTELYKRVNIDPYKRKQSLSMIDLFPNLEADKCACGCGEKLPKRARRWAKPDHADVGIYVMKVLQGDSDLIRRLLLQWLPLECAYCKKPDYEIVKYKDSLYNGRQYISYSASGIHVDHIVSVKNGGGGCWLGNYQFLCHTCNITKEQTDKLLRNKPTHLPISRIFD